jgi:3-oxoacyl-[acyl-carrier protein] reductase
MFSLAGKVALVTGASRGLGAGIAQVLAQAGADVAVNYRRSAEQAEKVATAVRELGRRSVCLAADVSQEEEVAQLFTEVQGHFGRLDILVANAGTSRAETISEITLESWREIIDNNLTSTFLCCKQALDIMRRQGGGRIIVISSMVGHNGALFVHVHYAATKSAQLGFVKTLARTAAPYGITVNAVAPGIIATELLYQTHGDEGVARLATQVPLGLGSVDDVGAAVAFLASAEARYITGTTLDVNGGMYMR